ncbi:MAG: hypothetical protein Q4D62_08725 [Planctomycetia bacterium]|nr:hypothetical protein [Planctomycetia bacterium]
MNWKSRYFLPVFLLGCFCWGVNGNLSKTQAEEKSPPTSDFIRIHQNPQGKSLALETSLVPYESEDGEISVTLIGAIHLGEVDYYQKLNEEFQNYDAVLYEVVAEEGARPESAAESGGVIGTSQRLMAYFLGMTFQIGSIDYHAENMFHADMTPEEFEKAIQQREEGFLVWYFRTLGYETARKSERLTKEDAQWLAFLLFPAKKHRLKRMMAEQMVDLDASIVPVEGKKGSALLQDRNEKVMRILQTRLDAGDRKIAIFYGAAHLPAMAGMLEKDFRLKKGEIRWIPAWDLTR